MAISTPEKEARISVRASSETIAKLEEIARQVRRSKSDVIRLVVEDLTPDAVRGLR